MHKVCPLQTLVECAQSHSSPATAEDTSSREPLQTLYDLAQRLLPELLACYGATLAPADQACLRLMRSLQVASQLTLRTAKQTYMTSGTAPLRDVEGEGATEPVLQLVELSGGMWGTLLQAALAAAPEAKADTPAAAEQRIGKLIQSAAHIEPRCARCIHQLMVCVLLLPHVLGHFTYVCLTATLVCTFRLALYQSAQVQQGDGE